MNNYNPIKLETPVAMTMHHDDPKFDVFLSSDEEGESVTKEFLCYMVT